MIRFFSALLQRRWSVLGAGLLLAVLGVVAWTRLPIDAFPDVTNIQVMVLSKAPGLSTEECEQRITYPIEQQMGGLPRVRLVRSLSRAGLSQVVIVFEDSVDPYFARQVVFERLQEARDALPEGIEPEMAPLSTGLGEIFQYTIEGDSLSAMERRTIQDWLIAPQLRSVPGVTEVNSFGGFAKQYEVRVHPERLVKYGLSLRDVIEAVEANNANAGAGYILKGWEQFYVVGRGIFTSIEDIETVVLKASDGTPVFLRDVAEVEIGAVTRQGAVTRDGKGETVAGMAIMLRGENSKTVVERVKEAVHRIQGGLPKGTRIDVFYDRTELIEACIKTVMDALLMGARARHPGPLPLSRRAADGAHRGALPPDHLPLHLPPHASAEHLRQPHEPRRPRLLRRDGRGRLDRDRGEHPPAPCRARHDGEAAGDRPLGPGGGGAAGRLLGADHRARPRAALHASGGRGEDVPAAGA